MNSRDKDALEEKEIYTAEEFGSFSEDGRERVQLEFEEQIGSGWVEKRRRGSLREVILHALVQRWNAKLGQIFCFYLYQNVLSQKKKKKAESFNTSTPL